MGRTNLKFKTHDGTNITYYRWNHMTQNKNGIVLILHGMAEHGLRYEAFAEYLNQKGLIVYACDHRGHGATGKTINKLGHFHGDGWQCVVDDIHYLLSLIKDQHNNLPIFLFGHSMGSLLARSCIYQFGNEFDGVILSGTTNGINFISRIIGLTLSKTMAFIYGVEKESKLLNDLFFGNYNKKFEGDIGYEWLSRDLEAVKEYNDDDLCGFTCTTGFFVDMMIGINTIVQKNNINKVPKELPMFILSGGKDPVGSNGKDVRKTYAMYKSSGIKNVKFKLYKDGRHEMLNELNKKDVYKDILQWIKQINQ